MRMGGIVAAKVRVVVLIFKIQMKTVKFKS